MPKIAAFLLFVVLASSVFAFALIGPLVLTVPPGWPHCGTTIVIGYLVGGIPGREPDGELVLLFQLPYIWGWVFLVVSLFLIWLRRRGNIQPGVA